MSESERIGEAELVEMARADAHDSWTNRHNLRLVAEVRRLRQVILAGDAYLRDGEGGDVILEEAKAIREESRLTG